MTVRSSLGFMPQRENIYTNYLPYSDRVDEESQIHLTDIKENLSKAVLLKDIRPGLYRWADALERYIHTFYGHKFSKDDHVYFIKLFYELITIPDLDPFCLEKFCDTLFFLLKKRKLLKRTDLELPWRPLYEVYNNLFFSTNGSVEMLLLPGYFPASSTQEMLDEWRPLMCVYDVTMMKAMMYLELFLPTTLDPKEHDLGFRLWFYDFIKLWETVHNVPSWEVKLVKLFSRLANENIGYIDWEPHIPLIFTRILRSFNLPVGYIKNIKSGSYSFKSVATEQWIIAMMGKTETCLSHITELFKALESYFHPSNAGRWILNLSNLLSRLSERLYLRVYRERYQNNDWKTPIPQSHKLTDDNITKFVQSIMPCVMLEMFSKLGSCDAATTFRYLAKVRPELVIPALLERLYPALETLTEPHRLTATLSCIISVGQDLVKGGKNYPEGPSHIVPLLLMSLPGIDTNDIKKCMATFQLISTFSSLIILDDCSKAVSNRNDLTPAEIEVCLSTAQCEDFVLEFMNKSFNLIQNSVLEHTNRSDTDEMSMNSEEGLLEVGLASVFTTILTHVSSDILKAALHKLQDFINGRVLETKVAGKFAAHMVRSAVKTNSEIALKTFLPHICEMIMTLTSNEEVMKEEFLDDELMFNLLLFSEVLLGDGQNLLKYKHQIEEVLTVTLKLTCKRGYKLAGAALSNVLNRITCTYLLNVSYSNQTHSADYIPIREWGKPISIKDMDIEWHIPSDEEVSWGSHLLNKFLVPTLKEFRDFCCGKVNLESKEVLKNLNITHKCFIGAAALLPHWKEEPINLMETQVPYSLSPPIVSVNNSAITIGENKNARAEICDVMSELIDFILKNCEDDTRSLMQIINILYSLIFYWGTNISLFEKRSKGFHIVKNIFKDKFAGKKCLIKALHIDRLSIVHENRCIQQKWYPFTESCKKVVKNLFRLATSHYSEVRTKSQKFLSEIYPLYHDSYLVIVSDILGKFITRSNMINVLTLQGTLHILLGKRNQSLMAHSYMPTIAKFWPAIIGMKHSEKPSIVKLVNCIGETILKKVITYSIRFNISPSCLEVAKSFFELSKDRNTKILLPSEKDMIKATEQFQKNCETDLKPVGVFLRMRKVLIDIIYTGLIEEITSKMLNDNLHWRQFELATIMLCVLIRKDITFPTRTSMDCCNLILKQQKRKNKSVEIDPSKLMPSPDSHLSSLDVTASIEDKPSNGLKFGHRKDNLWVLYDKSAHPDSLEKFNKSVFVHHTHWGYYTWPKNFKVFQQDEDSYYSESKNMPDVSCLFRNFQDQILPLLTEHLKELSSSNVERKQQCAAEIIAGMIRGSKFWNYQKMESLKSFVVPLLKSALCNVTVETILDWGDCVSHSLENRDPNKYYWLIEVLVDNAMNGESGSFLSCSHMHMILSGLGQQEWRIPDVMHRLLQHFVPHLANSLQNFRDRIANILTAVFLYDSCLEVNTPTLYPKRIDFMTVVKPMLKILTQDSVEESSSDNHKILANWEDKERKDAINLLKTVSKWTMATIARTPSPAPPELFQIFPLICHYESDITDEELRRICCITLATVGQAYLLPTSIGIAVETTHQIALSKSWHARTAALKYLQMMVFYNFFLVRNNKQWIASINELVIRLLEDEQVEVIANKFKAKCNRKLKKKLSTEQIISRHAGVLGLSACVGAHPYDVPQYVPDLLMIIGDHLHDPQPILSTVKKTLSDFKRTHLDSWRDHKLKFTNDQLVFLTDLLVSPNYYA
ncbi:Proteasome activator complex subunit 4 [Nymphon striatum]|nr:Proteasome activator complex subunit 4 [Nymphon striatum]